MKIEILGTGCPKCKKLYENTLAAVQTSGVSVQVEKIEDMEKIINYGVLSTPAIAIDGIIKSAGKLLSLDEIKALISK
ncbi:MAG: redox-active disulfide protein [Bdellovibrionales bacterium RIFOXYD12_FULL_39_22]|nr:MAG: redox-active disulfide protein [Bdellovibrionales bacterium RIFOXYB1_FULL_39_21]OFZ41429.1 MAG: redox-active disulfide protein [Bdellovibrionales bacterium RIFOXYC12_FULL_39_17]OFZ45385.1 MAG: redox-active disulfide protein [Bdellovibrionales bacterium RIFOXYC1_FULL_39_130]OFZ71232.1 MAG: redox-active disulfide protein [Bdellovibrionales bacterium RIFOXYC2_FULL_39_8]OFZ74581.1 MAG: redox-active disulfide protein [Bdellovibrionales bacterium RIFOXYD1_FULL_39_84]OFZ92589.1 MAG: redox-act